MKLGELKDGQVVTYRIGKVGAYEPQFGPWKTGPLYIHRRECDLPKQLRSRTRDWKAGDILTLVPRNDICAEMAQSDWSAEWRQFNCEDWYLEIQGLEP